MNIDLKGGVTSPLGFLAAGVHCGVKEGSDKNKPDLAIVYSDVRCAAAGVYTKNKVQSACIAVTKESLLDGIARAIVVNSGNANACVADGYEKAQRMSDATAEALAIDKGDIIVASTGVIGQPLNIAAVEEGIYAAAKRLLPSGADDAASAIMTTDLRKKQCSVSFELDEKTVTIGGMAKGSGMIHINMATMLCFLTTDAAISPKMLQNALSNAIERTLNRVSVDGDTSTNDMATIMANGLAENTEITAPGDAFDKFCGALTLICRYFAKEIARDGEGATKLLECEVCGAPNEQSAAILAKSVISSSLVKAAFFGCDANWGRIICALGYANCDVDLSNVDIAFAANGNLIRVCRASKALSFDETDALRILQSSEIRIEVCLHKGEASATAWGCDLSYDYVKINGSYRT